MFAFWPDRSNWTLFSLRAGAAAIPLWPLRADFSLQTLFSLRALFALWSAITGNTSLALWSRRPHRPAISFGTDWTAVAFRTDWTRVPADALRTYIAGVPFGTGVAADALRSAGARKTGHSARTNRPGAAHITFWALRPAFPSGSLRSLRSLWSLDKLRTGWGGKKHTLF